MKVPTKEDLPPITLKDCVKTDLDEEEQFECFLDVDDPLINANLR